MLEKSTLRCVSTTVALLLVVAAARADVRNMPAGQTSLQIVVIGDPGNAPDAAVMTSSGIPAAVKLGEVDYVYSMSKYEVTVAQYCQFLNAKMPSITSADPESPDGANPPADTYGLFSWSMAAFGGVNPSAAAAIGYDPNGATGAKFYIRPGYDNHPATYITGLDGVRFVNWLQNGQGDGDTESGTYTISGSGQNSIVTVPSSRTGLWVLPSENEWYKAAYYKGGGTNSGYFTYSTSHDNIPSYYPPGTPGADPTNSANYFATSPPGLPVANKVPLDVGSYPDSISPYGTLDQGGNAQEWTDTPGRNHPGQWIVRGGDFNIQLSEIASTHWNEHPWWLTIPDFGFRVAYIGVPEPGSLVMLAGIAVAGLLYGRRRQA